MPRMTTPTTYRSRPPSRMRSQARRSGGWTAGSTVAALTRRTYHRLAARRAVEHGRVERRLDVDPVVARLGVVLRPLGVGVGVALGRAHRLDRADPVDPCRAAQRRAAASGVGGGAECRRAVAVPPARIFE